MRLEQRELLATNNSELSCPTNPIFLILIIRFVSSNQGKVRFEVHLGELWTVDSRLPAGCGLSTIIRSTSIRLQAPGVIADNHIFN